MEDSLTAVIGNLKQLSKAPPRKPKRPRLLVKADGQFRFWVFKGPSLSDLRDLKAALEIMTDEQYSYHVNGQKNDFASWVSAILHNPTCAADLITAKDQHEASSIVAKALQSYTL